MHIQTSPADAIPPADAAALAGRLYGIHGTAEPLAGEYDSNYRLTARDGARYVLKLMHPSRELGFIDMQCQALLHLARRAPDLPLPRVCEARDGAVVTRLPPDPGAPRYVWMLSYVPGRPMAAVRPHTPALFRSLGTLLGRMDAGLADFTHPATARELKWDLTRAGWVRDYLDRVTPLPRRVLAERCLALYEGEVVPALPGLRRSVVHNDANDYNVLVSGPRARPPLATSVIDFGDLLHTPTVAELAIAAAYALLDQPDPLAAAAHVAAGYDAVLPLSDAELALLYPLICTRLMVSVVNSACRKALFPDDPYVTISEAPAWAGLERLLALPPRLAHYTFRQACGRVPVPRAPAIAGWLRAEAPGAAPVLGAGFGGDTTTVFDLSVGSRLLGADPAALAAGALAGTLETVMAAAGARVGVGRYDEARPIYTAPLFGADPSPVAERRTVHLGLDLFAPAGTPVHAPLAGTVAAFADNARPQDYGPVLLLRHETAEGFAVHTLYGHLSRDSLAGLSVGQPVALGALIGAIGGMAENGGWPPHLHLQVIADPMDLGTDFPGVAPAGFRSLWTSLSPDPNLLLGIPAEQFPDPAPPRDATLAARRERLGGNLSLSYQTPLKIVRGWRQYLYDETGRAYLDVYNNVPLVGHSHPHVVRAIREQVGLLNTNTRYLHDNITAYAARLTARMPDPLRVCFFVNSGSEANELALRLARAHTGRQGVIVLDHAYHGNTAALVDISPYKFNGPGGGGRKPWVHVVPMPDDYRGRFRRDDPAAGRKYAADAADIVARESGIAAYIAETLPSVGGQVVLPPGYLDGVYRAVRAAGGLCIADEVQVGFGRLGSHFWGFETQGVVPDIVVLGKPIGNGFPLAAVVTSRAIAASFDNGMEFFSTFGGNPVACAAGLAVLEVLEREGLQENARDVGGYLLDGLRGLMARHPLVGDARGMGLFLGLELVRSRETLEPAGDEASYLVNRLRDCGILAGTDGPYHNVIKIRPPLSFSRADADLLLATLDLVLAEDPIA